VQVVTSERGGFEVLDLLSGAERAVIVDCLEVPDPCPGRVRQLALDRIAGVARLVGAHDLNIATVFRLASEMGVAMPEKVEIYGVEAADTRSFGERLSGEVETAVRALARDLHARLKEEAGRPAPPSASAA
jgi:hydrogenase maturation protease